ncbi:LemA family protein [Serratia microhaemolytica]|uniref:LemA family protein n=1 Tax=Serratia microhaemolytica TaxID=2675110 RepID=UPI000FDF20DA|nr:LemA family protein [Serratia microhaemolytica]
MPIFYLVLIVVMLLIGLGTVSYFIRVYNQMVMMRNNVDKSFANIDVLLKQRADEIPNLIKVVKQLTSYESSLLEELTAQRTRYLTASNIDEKVGLSNEMDKTIKSIFAVSENYPEIKADKNFMLLQQRVSEFESQIADRRELYNESVTIYNTGIKEFPPVLLAKWVGYHQLNLLVISEQEKSYHGIQF